MNKLLTPQARLALAEGRKHHFRFAVAGQGDLPEEGYKDEWWTEILKSPESIPPEGRPAYNVVKKAGVPIKAVYIRHEAPRLLTAPKDAPQKAAEPKTDVGDVPDLSNALGVVVGVLGLALTVMGVIFLFSLRIDPILYVVLEDGTHVEVAKWYDYISQ